jgi:hypothetical protein
MTDMTLATNLLNDDDFSNESTYGLMPTNSNYSLTDPPQCKRMNGSIYIFIVTKV